LPTGRKQSFSPIGEVLFLACFPEICPKTAAQTNACHRTFPEITDGLKAKVKILHGFWLFFR